MSKPLGVFLFSLCLILIMSCTKATTVPADLLGRWVTEAGLHEDRYIEINETELVFGTGTDLPTVFLIEKIKQNKTGEFVEWTFNCRTIENVPADIVLFYTNTVDGVHFELRNKRQVHWVKLED